MRHVLLLVLRSSEIADEGHTTAGPVAQCVVLLLVILYVRLLLTVTLYVLSCYIQQYLCTQWVLFR